MIMYQENLDYHSKQYVDTYEKCLRSLQRKPIQNFHELPYRADTIEAAYQAEKDAQWLRRIGKQKKGK